MFNRITTTKNTVKDIPDILGDLKYKELLEVAERFRKAGEAIHVKVADLEVHDWANLLHLVATEWSNESNKEGPGLLLENEKPTKQIT